jgi:hypothetical protein
MHLSIHASASTVPHSSTMDLSDSDPFLVTDLVSSKQPSLIDLAIP